jgi:Icc-related predicted phosphoesterase
VAAVGDLHCTKGSQGFLQPLCARVAETADMLLLAGDLTNAGLPEEAQVLARELAGMRVPTVAVLGNHDFESDKSDEVVRILTDGGIAVLDGEAHEIGDVGLAGVKGFGGGFGQRALAPWGEAIVKHFVREAVDEALKLEAALARLRRMPRVAVLHYSPIQDTVEGEPLEIFPFLGSSRLEEPINRYRCDVVFHGHAHRGRPEGKTSTGVPVYNVCVQLLRHAYPDHPPYRLFEIPVEDRELAHV